VKSDLDKLQGVWNLVTVEVDGQKFPSMGAKIAVDGNRFEALNMGAEYKGLMTVDEASLPKTFDLLYDAGPHTGKSALAIYEIDQDDWKLCIGLVGVPRPKEFVSAKGSGHALETLKRETGSPSKATPVSGAPTELEGEWAMQSCVQDGQKMQKTYTASMHRAFEGGNTKLYFGPKVMSQSSFSIPAKGQIDFHDLNQKGIYELNGDALKTATAAPGTNRPDDFAADPGAGRTVSEWRRK
jgi:uncharacterized protein (TIGR03067 family)